LTAPRVKTKHDIVAAVEAALLQKLRECGSIARVDLARELKLSPSTVGIYVSRLIAEGYVDEGEQVTRKFGRPATILSRRPSGGRFVGVDMEARNIYVMSVDFAQQQIAHRHARLTSKERSTEAVMLRAETLIDDIGRGDNRKLLGIGIGVPGKVDPVRGVAVHYKHIFDWRNVPIRERLQQRFAVPVQIENNVRSRALAELWFGRAKGLKNFVCVVLRTGIGAGIVADGQLARGMDNAAGEIGAWQCYLPGHSDTNSVETLESLASVNGILERYAASSGVELRTFSAFLERLRANDPLAQRMIADASQVCGVFIAQMNLMLNPERIIIAGDVVEAGDPFMQPLRVAAAAAPSTPMSSPAQIELSELGLFGGAMGAAALAAQAWRPAR